jgi:thioredoxin-related protein
MKLIFVISGIFSLFGISISILYEENLRYSMPTPIPKNHSSIEENAFIEPPDPILKTNSKPMLIHFFNPNCPCSRFNLEHFKNLFSQFSNSVDFRIVLQIEKENSIEKFKKMEISIPALVDRDSAIAKRYGIYSTPQAVILDKTGKLYYKGNYNKSRYCALRSSEYARIALEKLLKEELLKEMPLVAKIAYGCELPIEGKKRYEFIESIFGY